MRSDAPKRAAEHAHGIDTGEEVARSVPDLIAAFQRTVDRAKAARQADERSRLAAKATASGVLTIRDLCGDRDLERYDSHDYCTAHDVSVPTDGICPVTLGILTATRQSAADAVLTEARQLCCGNNSSAHHAASAKHSERMAFAGDLARAVRGL